MSDFTPFNELNGGAELLESVPQVSSVQRWELGPESYVDNDFIEEPEIQAEVVGALARSLGQLGIDPESVVFSGYDAIHSISGGKSVGQNGKHTYYFNNFEALKSDSSENPFNPLHWAGVSTGATICVYDKAKLKALDSSYWQDDTEYLEGVIEATPEEMGSSLVLIFHPRFMDTEGNTFDATPEASPEMASFLAELEAAAKARLANKDQQE